MRFGQKRLQPAPQRHIVLQKNAQRCCNNLRPVRVGQRRMPQGHIGAEKLERCALNKYVLRITEALSKRRRKQVHRSRNELEIHPSLAGRQVIEIVIAGERIVGLFFVATARIRGAGG